MKERNDILNAMIERRSIRGFKPDMPSEELIDDVIEAGLYAASGMGKQSPIIIEVTDKETRDKLSALNAELLLCLSFWQIKIDLLMYTTEAL